MAFDLARATKYFLMWDFIKGFGLGMRISCRPSRP
jgi:NADH-quinone oxidoreductase subunit I